jgi:glycosyltransferase 2 family protein
MGKSRTIWLIIILAVIVYLLMSIYADLGSLAAALKDFRVALLPAVLILTTVNYLFRFLKWDFFLKRAGVRLKLKDNLFVFFSGLSMIVTPGKLGEVWKAWLVKDIDNTELSRTIPVVLVERITDVTGLLLLSLTGIFIYTQSVILITILLVLFAMFFIIVKSRKVSQWITSVLEKRAGKHTGNIQAMHQTLTELMEPKGLASMTLLSAFAWFFECLGMYLVVLGFAEAIDILQATFVFSFSSLAGAVSMIPGGLGVAEVSISGLLRVFGFGPAVAVGIAMIIRFGTLWFGAFLGLLVFILFRHRVHRFEDNIT